ncbi:MAG TPA: 7,8-didemethyl-8-hydroxy-5-deazariboflavin synthase subunit CofG [Methanosarcinales archaeon]|nr:7,8-didemethyl-8-hydroxy-5-deazariboflavin synthase subunit CofG [Methanosarcinales archaeon]
MPDYVTFTRNVFLPVTNVCRNRCRYCGFRRDPSHPEASLMTVEEIEQILKQGARFGCTEALFTFGEKPEEHQIFREWIGEIGYFSIIDYLVDLCELAIEYGLLPHSNPGVMDFRDIKRLKPLNASMGLMLETTADLPAHEGCAGKILSERIKAIENAGKLKMPFTTGLLIGIGESMEDRVHSLYTIRELHLRYRHIQEVIIQPFSPKPGTDMADFPEATHQEMVDTVMAARRILPRDVAIQVPPNLTRFEDLIGCGASDLGGVSPYTIDWINPETKWPQISELAGKLSGIRLRERLPIYPGYVLARWYDPGLGSLIERYTDGDGFRDGYRH